MDKILAYCGLVCQGCPVYLATRQRNKEKRKKMRAEIARICQEEYGLKYKLQDITDCDGCKTKGGRLLKGCSQCKIRKCAQRKKFENCAYCAQYACKKLKKFLVTDQEAKARLDVISSMF